jgi:hypothetical protein
MRKRDRIDVPLPRIRRYRDQQSRDGNDQTDGNAPQHATTFESNARLRMMDPAPGIKPARVHIRAFTAMTTSNSFPTRCRLDPAQGTWLDIAAAHTRAGRRNLLDETWKTR